MNTLLCRVPGRRALGTALVLALLTLLALCQTTSAQETHQDLLPTDSTTATVTAAGSQLRAATDRGHRLLARLQVSDLRAVDLTGLVRSQPVVTSDTAVPVPLLGALSQPEPVVTPETQVEAPPLTEVALLQPVVTPESAIQLPILEDVALLQPVVTPESAVQLPVLDEVALLQPVVTPESAVYTPVLGAIAWFGPVVTPENAVQTPLLGSTAVLAPVVSSETSLPTPSLTTVAPATTTPALTLIPGEPLLRGSLLPATTPSRDATAGPRTPTWQAGQCLTLPDAPTLSPCAQPLLATSPGTTTPTTPTTIADPATSPLPTTGGQPITELPVTGSGDAAADHRATLPLLLLLLALALATAAILLRRDNHVPSLADISWRCIPRPGRLTVDDSRIARAAAAAAGGEVPHHEP